ncbi:F-box domain-containing protein [Mycena sanguinolenta]|uniref:F-box domain-containing protein n=1 Tax=Mycena sanguinolenta TaxID=230812 RepID=A0A8H6YIW5_9AGAR|nr:F-box domain-containing protein [Mycena sanguinolenta]
MAEIDSQLEHYDPEISRLKKILADLQARKARLQWYQECCSSIISPIRKLPPEVLGMIFLGCMGPEPNVIPVVGQVCRHWRDLVESTPRLWVNISVGRKRFTFHQRYVNMASLFLKRSLNRPLFISIRNPADARLVTLVRRHADRWATLRLASTDNAFYNFLGLDGALPMLEKLEILEGASRLANPEAIPIKIHHAPKLKHVVLKDGPEYWDLPWTQLTRLEYDTSNVIDAVYILRMCPHLEECSLGMLNQAVEDPDAITTIRPLLELRSLRLAIDTVSPNQPAATIMSTFFSAVTAPVLTSLEVIGQWTPTEFTDFLTRNQCQLTHLSLGPGYMKDDKIIDVLQALPHVKHASARCGYWDLPAAAEPRYNGQTPPPPHLLPRFRLRAAVSDSPILEDQCELFGSNADRRSGVEVDPMGDRTVWRAFVAPDKRQFGIVREKGKVGILERCGIEGYGSRGYAYITSAGSRENPDVPDVDGGRWILTKQLQLTFLPKI